MEEVKRVIVGDKVYEISDKKHLNGYLYDSLVYRYIRAREHMAEREWEINRYKHDRDFYFQNAKRDIMRFCEILNEAIGEHD